MSSVSAAERPCFICGHGIPLEAFLEWPDTRDGRFAICGWCGAPNEQQDTAFVVLDPAYPAARLVETLRLAPPRAWLEMTAAGAVPEPLASFVADLPGCTVDMVPGETDFTKDGLPRVFDCNLIASTYLFVRGDEKRPRKDKPLVTINCAAL